MVNFSKTHVLMTALLMFGLLSASPTISYDGNYTIYTFTDNGVFNISRDINAEILLVAGGGSGGASGGGGGAGGLIHNTSYFIPKGIYPIVVGLGQIGTDVFGCTNAAGGTTTFNTSSLVAYGGGRGGCLGTDGDAGRNGGSGGGGAATGSGGTGIVGQGNNGSNNVYPVGGGGGGSGSTSGGTNGGSGTTLNISGTNVDYAAGGGTGGNPPILGGNGGASTAGQGGDNTRPCTPGQNGTGSGGGGSKGQYEVSCSGGSGIVIIKVPNTPAYTAPNVTVDGNYTVYTFTGNSWFNIPVNLTVSMLVVAGGGGGGYGIGGGGGAGGLIYNSSYYLPAGNYSIVVGDGGYSTQYGIYRGGSGGDSSFNNTLTAIGGGGGGSAVGCPDTAGLSGGSGGGGSCDNVGGAGTSGQGYAGGSGSSSPVGGGGGGGYSQAGWNVSGVFNNSFGGEGIELNISGVAKNYSCGGGGTYVTGGTGGCSNAGNGTNNIRVASDAVANTGCGGGGAGAEMSGAGGSGVVIIRYLTVDYTPGNVSNVSPTATTRFYANPITLHINATGSNLSYEFYVKAASDPTYLVRQNSTNSSFIATYAEGNYVWYARVCSIGTCITTAVTAFMVNFANPQITISSPITSSIYANPVSIAYTITDTNLVSPGYCTIQFFTVSPYALERSDYIDCASIDYQFTSSIDTDYLVVITAVDALGITNSTSRIFRVGTITGGSSGGSTTGGTGTGTGAETTTPSAPTYGSSIIYQLPADVASSQFVETFPQAKVILTAMGQAFLDTIAFLKTDLIGFPLYLFLMIFAGGFAALKIIDKKPLDFPSASALVIALLLFATFVIVGL